MGAALAINRTEDVKYNHMVQYLSAENGYWLDNDHWKLEDAGFRKAGIKTGPLMAGELADFSGYPKGRLKIEAKYFLVYVMKNELLSVPNIYGHYQRAIKSIGAQISRDRETTTLACLKTDIDPNSCTATERLYRGYVKHLADFFTDYYDDREEFEKDIWYSANIPGAKVSAAGKRMKLSMNFQEIPMYYRAMVKRYMRRLVVRRSWSFCTEMLVYIRYMFRVFYNHGYEDGFLYELTRGDVEKYLCWVAEDYEGKNATFKSKAVSFIRQFIDYIQLAEYSDAPEKEVNRLFFDDDVPRRERPEDGMERVKYIPEPVKESLDACIGEIKPAEMMPVYVLLRESGWRGTDILNLRYDSCLEYIWNSGEKDYVPYLCGEITKTGIPQLKIPIRPEVASLVKKLVEQAKSLSTSENNPSKYLFNTYTGRSKGFPYSMASFSRAVRILIEQKNICDGDGNLYHFKTHSLRHTRAMEYTEQGMPIGIIQQMLGHCSLQMTLHYAKVSEDTLYKKWKETEKLGIFHLSRAFPQMKDETSEDVHLESVRKGLDAVKVPFGMCFGLSKLNCRQQFNPCLSCGSFCATKDNIPEIEAEILRVKEHLNRCDTVGRLEWKDKNERYLARLETMLARIRENGIVHKNASSRENYNV